MDNLFKAFCINSLFVCFKYSVSNPKYIKISINILIKLFSNYTKLKDTETLNFYLKKYTNDVVSGSSVDIIIKILNEIFTSNSGFNKEKQIKNDINLTSIKREYNKYQLFCSNVLFPLYNQEISLTFPVSTVIPMLVYSVLSSIVPKRHKDHPLDQIKFIIQEIKKDTSSSTKIKNIQTKVNILVEDSAFSRLEYPNILESVLEISKDSELNNKSSKIKIIESMLDILSST
jgi:hypothetical protein